MAGPEGNRGHAATPPMSLMNARRRIGCAFLQSASFHLAPNAALAASRIGLKP
jgi:hypothetical protein